LPYIEQQAIYEQYNFALAFNSAANGAVGMNVVPAIYCPSGPAPQKYTDPNTGVLGNPPSHYLGVMGPGGLTNPTVSVLGGVTYNYTVGDANNNGAWSAHGILSHFRVTAGSASTNRYIRFSDILDGTSNTLMVGERSVFLPPGQSNDYRSWIRGNSGGSGSCKNVTYPINSTNYNGSNNFNHISFGSQHPGGCLFALGDASVQFVSESIDMAVYMALASMNEGAVVSISN